MNNDSYNKYEDINKTSPESSTLTNLTNDFPRKVVYFEFQSRDKLCGLHCINSLLQGPFFDPVSLAEIAQKLDELEKQLLGGDSYSIYKSGNVDIDGNYNLQVLTEALKVYGAEIVPVKHSECEAMLNSNTGIDGISSVDAFIFNSSTHWFSIRKICNVWFNLNSTNATPGPQIISDFYLSAFLKGTEELGYTNFLIKNLPDLPEVESLGNMNSSQKLVPIEIIKASKPKKINMGDSDEMELEKAIELSKQQSNNSKNDNTDNFQENYQNFNENFQGNYQNFNENYGNHQSYSKDEMNMIEQNELDAIMQLSINEYFDDLKKCLSNEPSLDDDYIEINFITSCDSNTMSRRFSLDNKIEDVKNYIKINKKTQSAIAISFNDKEDNIDTQ